MSATKKTKKKAATGGTKRPTQARRVPPGIYRVCIITTYVERAGDMPALCWALEVVGPLGARGALLKRSRLEHPEDGLALRRELAVLGVNLVSWRGLDLARPQLNNVHAFVEVLPCALEGEDRVHILQRATAHELALPDEWTLTEEERAAREAEVDFSFDTSPMAGELSAEG